MDGALTNTAATDSIATLPVAGANVFAMTISLLLVVAAIFAVAWVMKRVQGKHRATGGTLDATASLVRGLGATVVGASVLIELAFLGGRERLNGVPLHAAIGVS